MSKPSYSFLVAGQRSGTHALGSVINSGLSTRYLGEIFHKRHNDSPTRFLASNPPQIMSEMEFEASFETFLRNVSNMTKRHVLIDIKYSDIRKITRIYGLAAPYEGILAPARKDGAAIIHLKRRNKLAQALSLIRGKKTKEMQVTTKPSDVKITVDPKEVLALAKQFADDETLADHSLAGTNKLVLWYEELFEASGGIRHEVLSAISKHLGVADRFETTPATVKIAPARLEDLVANYDEMISQLRQSEEMRGLMPD